jgi:hypothetical protein
LMPDSPDENSPLQLITVTNGSDASTLKGDSGGPLYVAAPAWHVQGVLSGGGPMLRRKADGVMKRDELSVYIDVSFFGEWMACVTKNSSHPLTLNAREGAPGQIPCTPGDEVVPMEKVAARNESLCGRWSGWSLATRPGETIKAQCWPANKVACEAHATLSGEAVRWDDAQGKCVE